MKAMLKELRRVIPDFHSHIPLCEIGAWGSPKALRLDIQSTSEAAYQRAFFRQRSTRISGSTDAPIDITWLDIEVPVVPGNTGRRHALDMIGAVDGTPSVIAELKGVNGTSPFNAIQEVLSYGCRAREHYKQLMSHPRATSSLGDIEISKYWPTYDGKYLIVGAPEQYWVKWKAHWELVLAVGSKWFVQSGLRGHRLIFAAFPAVDFKKQKARQRLYTPAAAENHWSVISEVHCPASANTNDPLV